MTRFIHTSDWQLGITRRFLNAGVQERYSHARLDAIRRIAAAVRERECRFVVVCGDVFESNQVSRGTVAKALEALRDIPVPVYLLPGNHDPLNDASVYVHSHFTDRKPDNVHVIANATPVQVDAGVELVGAPWLSKRPGRNPFQDVLAATPPADGRVRILLGHGEVDALAPFSDSPTMLGYDALRAAVADKRAHFIALGDKHSLARVGDDRIWYSGTPETTDFREPDPGWINLVEVDSLGVRTEAIRTGSWRFLEMEEDGITGGEAVRDLLARLEGVPDKERCVLRLAASGLIGLSDMDALTDGLAHLRELFAAFDFAGAALHCRVDSDEAALDRFTGFAAETVAKLRENVLRGGGDAEASRDALLLLLHLAREGGHAL